MKKFLETHNLTVTRDESNEVYFVLVQLEDNTKVEMMDVYCWYDVLRIMKHYLHNDADDWYRVSVENC